MSEAAEQESLFSWVEIMKKIHYEFKFIHHIPNGGSRGGNPRQRAINGYRMQKQGVKRGVLDVFWPLKSKNFPGLYIEMKDPKLKPKTEKGKGGVSDEQQEFIDFARSQQFRCEVCYDWIAAKEIILEYFRSR